jgi:hypothetical protein
MACKIASTKKVEKIIKEQLIRLDGVFRRLS